MNGEGQAATAASKPKHSNVRKPVVIASEIALLQEISKKLDRVVAVLAVQGKERDKQIEILLAAGCDSAFVGTVVGLTGGAVRVFQSRQRTKGGALGRGPTTNDKD